MCFKKSINKRVVLSTYLFKRNSGFTLIELLVVISIIGLLSSVVLVAFNGARIKARDAKRKTDIVQIMKAMALYYDTNNRFPSSGGAVSPNSGWSNSGDSSWTSLGITLSQYLSKMPNDPKQSPSSAVWGSSGPAYSYFSCGGRAYMLVYQLEEADGPDPGVNICGTMYRYGGTGNSTKVKTVGYGSN